MSQYSDAELLTMLGGALSPTPAAPDAATLSLLHMTLADISAKSGPVATAQVRPQRTIGALRRRAAQHASVFAVAAAVILTGGVATAAVATDTLPGATRNFAYDLGLPVTSPGLYQARQNLNQLKRSIVQGDRHAQVHWGSELQHDLKSLNDDDLAQIRVPALSLLSEAGLEDPLPSPATTSITSPATKGGFDSDLNSPGPTSTVPNSSGSDSSDANQSGPIPPVPTLTIPGPTDILPVTTLSGDGVDESLAPTSSVSSDQVTTTVIISPVAGDL